ncbi:MAG TPA: chemoreceptor glutamine deamidase CheD [Woeseiaceae bacterium]
MPGFENVRRYRNASGQLIAKLLPGDFYVTTTGDEVLDTVLGSCVSACIRNPRLKIGGMNHFMLPRPSGSGNDTWDNVSGRATRYGSASMEQLINRILGAGGTRGDLEVKIFGGGRVLSSLTDVGNHNVIFVRDYLKQEGIKVTSEDVGDTCPRHVQYFPMTGRVRVRHLRSAKEIATHEQQYLQVLEKTPVAGEIDLF